nr:sodium/calcium exchanger NCL2-like [Tanacetum cinerariifolium]
MSCIQSLGAWIVSYPSLFLQDLSCSSGDGSRSVADPSSQNAAYIKRVLDRSITFLLVYFIYQVFEPSIQTRRLSYVKYEHLVIDILKHLQDQIAENILTEDGSVNLPAIKRLFKKIDQDGDDIISFSELKELLKSIKFRQLKSDKQKTFDQLIKEFDSDGNAQVSLDEFIHRFTEWLDEAKNELSELFLDDEEDLKKMSKELEGCNLSRQASELLTQ